MDGRDGLYWWSRVYQPQLGEPMKDEKFLIERLVVALEKIAKDGIVLHQHHYEHEANPDADYKTYAYVPASTGQKPDE